MIQRYDDNSDSVVAKKARAILAELNLPPAPAKTPEERIIDIREHRTR